ncbi:hypothetical protein FHG87_012890 [Trinorchestia longiramus]|nr:hypothetical protein FHG87_012890 [Trinorchestia longiramus]
MQQCASKQTTMSDSSRATDYDSLTTFHPNPQQTAGSDIITLVGVVAVEAFLLKVILWKKYPKLPHQCQATSWM